MGRHEIKKILKYSTIGIFILIITSYAAYQAKSIVEGPIIVITSPKSGSSSLTSLIDIEGHTNNIKTIDINNRPIFIDDNGFFREKHLLSTGYNIILIQAKDKFNRSTQKTIEITYLTNL